MGWDPRIFGLPQIGAEMGRKCRILHRNKKYKKDIKIQLVSQWVFSMSFKITKVKLLFLGWFFVLFVHLLRKWRIPNFPRSSGGKHDKNDIKKITFSVHIITGNSRGVWGSVVSETARIQRLVTLARLVSQADETPNFPHFFLAQRCMGDVARFRWNPC